MALNIKSQEADRLVAELAKLTGESKTQAVIEAVRERLARETQARSSRQTAEELLAVGKKCASYPRLDTTSHGDLLYDDHGLPQ